MEKISKKHLAIKIALALLPTLVFTQDWAWMSLNSSLFFAFLVFWVLTIWQVVYSEDKNYIIHRLIWLTEIAFFILPLSAIVMTFNLGSQAIGSSSGLAQSGAAIGTAIGGFFAVGLGAVIGLFGGIICHLVSKKFKSKIVKSDDDNNNNFYLKTRNWAFLAGVIILIIVSMAVYGNASSNKGNSSESQKAVEQKNNEIKEKMKAIEIVSSKIEKDIIDQPNLIIKVKNNSDKIIDGINIKAKIYNNFDEQVKGLDNDYFEGTSQETINPKEMKEFQWSLTFYSGATKVKELELTRVHFTDGEDWNLE